MSKQNYAVCCYTCEHNVKETCKGCNTILNGENEPYENWQLREDLCQKDEQIADLQHRLEVTEKALNKMAKDWCLIDNPNKPSDVVKKYKEQAEKEYTQQGIKGRAKELTLKKGQELSYEEKRLLGYFPKETS